MARTPLTVLNNATGFSLRWTASGVARILATGVSSWEGHFAPASGRVSASAAQRFGASIGAQLITDYETDLEVGDVLVITTLRGESVDERYEIKGRDAYPSSYLPHRQVYLTKYKQGGL